MMSQRLARLRVPGVWRTIAAVALMVAAAGPALAASAVPHCFDSELATVSQAFDDVAPADSAMRVEGDETRRAPASNGLAGVLVSRALIEIADSYGFRWDCTTQAFVATTPTTGATTTSTTTTTTTGAPPTTSIMEQAVPSFTVNTSPAPTVPARATTSTTRSPREFTGSAETQDPLAASTTEPAALSAGATIDSPAEEGGDQTVPLQLAAPAPQHGGDAGRTAAVVAALAGVVGVGAGLLLGSRHLLGSKGTGGFGAPE
jgi:hypothetical protein